ncbi:hypothetical protein WA158_002803 [Blastocystis sp. Blastoise]
MSLLLKLYRPAALTLTRGIIATNSIRTFAYKPRKNVQQKIVPKKEEDDTVDDSEVIYWKPDMKPEDIFDEEEMKDFKESEKEYLESLNKVSVKDQNEDTNNFLKSENINPEELVGYNTIVNKNADPATESPSFINDMVNEFDDLLDQDPEAKKQFEEWKKNVDNVMEREATTGKEASEEELDTVCKIPDIIMEKIIKKYEKELKTIGFQLDVEENEISDDSEKKENMTQVEKMFRNNEPIQEQEITTEPKAKIGRRRPTISSDIKNIIEKQNELPLNDSTINNHKQCSIQNSIIMKSSKDNNTIEHTLDSSSPYCDHNTINTVKNDKYIYRGRGKGIIIQNHENPSVPTVNPKNNYENKEEKMYIDENQLEIEMSNALKEMKENKKNKDTYIPTLDTMPKEAIDVIHNSKLSEYNYLIGTKPSLEYSLKSYSPASEKPNKQKIATRRQQQLSQQVHSLLDICLGQNSIPHPTLQSLKQGILIKDVIVSADSRDITVLWDMPPSMACSTPWFSDPTSAPSLTAKRGKHYQNKPMSTNSLITAEDVSKALIESKGKIRYFLGKNLNLRRVPDIHFRIEKRNKSDTPIMDILKEDEQRQKDLETILKRN